MSRPWVATLLVLFIVAAFHHMQLGMQVVIEDYVHSEWLKITSLVALKFAALVLAVASAIAVLRVAL